MKRKELYHLWWFQIEQTLWSPWLIQAHFCVVRVKRSVIGLLFLYQTRDKLYWTGTSYLFNLMGFDETVSYQSDTPWDLYDPDPLAPDSDESGAPYKPQIWIFIFHYKTDLRRYRGLQNLFSITSGPYFYQPKLSQPLANVFDTLLYCAVDQYWVK